MKLTIMYALLIFLNIYGCTPAKIAFDDSGWNKTEELKVKGRQGFLIKQKLSFGEFQTTTVKRSWTKGSSWGFSAPLANDWVDRLNIEFVQRKQTMRFNMADEHGNESEVTAFSRVKWQDLSIGNNPNSIVNIIGDILQIGDEGSNTYAVRIIPGKNEPAWEMLIDNHAAQRHAKSYKGLLAKNDSQYYTIEPVYKLKNKKGKAVSLPLGGSIGFSFKNREGKTLAAVSVIDNGIVYFSAMPANEKFLLANAAAAILLQQQIDEG